MTNVEAVKAAMKARVQANNKQGWGVDDSQAVILAAIANETGAKVEELDELAGLIKPFINPSATRQWLESNGVLDKVEKKEKKSKNSVLLEGLAD